MRTHFLTTILLMYACYGIAQSTQNSSLAVWQDQSVADTARLAALYEFIVGSVLKINPDSAVVLASSGYELSAEKGLIEEQAEALLIRGRAYNQGGGYDLAEADILRGVAILDSIGARSSLAEGLLHLANLQLDRVQYGIASASLDRSAALYREIGDSAGIATVLIRKSYASKNQAEYAEAMEYALEALRIREKLKDDAGSAGASIELSDILYYQEKYKESIEYAVNALEIMTRIGDEIGVADAHLMIGESYLILDEYDLALENINIALSIKERLNSPPLRIGSIVNSRGNVYKFREEYENALGDYRRALAICEELNFDIGIMATTANVGHVYLLMERYEEGLPYILETIEMMEASENRINIVENYMHASTAYEGLGQYDKALEWYQKYSVTKDSIFTLEKDQTLSELRTQYETEKKEEQIDALEKEALLKELARQRDRQIRILLIVLAALLILVAVGLLNRLQYIRKSRTLIQKEKDRSEHLLLNILPEEVAAELKEKGHADAHLIEDVTVIFTDFKGFTALSEQLTPQELVHDLNECFSAFDRIVGKYGIEKIKTIGDAYMAAGGLPTPNSTHATDVIMAALEIRDFIEEGKAKKIKAGLPYFEIRIGIHTGPVVAGIVGVKKFQYDIWGDTVNTASHMESSGEAGQVNISETTYELVRDHPKFQFIPRGKVKAKGKGEIDMYFVRPAE